MSGRLPQEYKDGASPAHFPAGATKNGCVFTISNPINPPPMTTAHQSAMRSEYAGSRELSAPRTRQAGPLLPAAAVAESARAWRKDQRVGVPSTALVVKVAHDNRARQLVDADSISILAVCSLDIEPFRGRSRATRPAASSNSRGQK